jgi:hypothetical protein
MMPDKLIQGHLQTADVQQLRVNNEALIPTTAVPKVLCKKTLLNPKQVSPSSEKSLVPPQFGFGSPKSAASVLAPQYD